ncbi:hypothetical protein CIRG_02386 [Coccidioides immitis RMSCC 2394]|uniref:Uncharacterized protein n=1 Tax=Coccidioides immitis RMSCC 2394 TaxID=404692 RepID=A0A0J6Y6P5_COCIT|nr:hypothetical protein CIRG_02386 [Coccidioides immitis RMSCC 2394]
MSAHRVIQDSDESDDELADPTTFDLFQEPRQCADASVMNHDGNTSPRLPGQTPSYPIVKEGSSLGPDLMVNHKQAFIHPGQVDLDVNSRSNCELDDRDREQVDDCGENLQVAHEDYSPGCPDGTTDNRMPSSGGSIKRGRTIGVLEEIQDLSDPENRKAKRRKSSTAVDSHDYHNGGPRHHRRLTDCSTHDDGRFHTELIPTHSVSSTPNNEMLQHNITMDPVQESVCDTTPLDYGIGNPIKPPTICAQSPKNIPGRSKSVPIPTDSPHDTEPMSSTTLSRARRTMTNCEAQLPTSPANSIDELSLPISVQIAVDRSRLHSLRPQPRSEDDVASERDELGSDDFGGMPMEMYKPRPSRSRSKKTIEDELGMSHITHEVMMSSHGEWSGECPHSLSKIVEQSTEENRECLEQGDPQCLTIAMNTSTAGHPATTEVQFSIQPNAPMPMEGSKPERKTSKKKKLKRGKTTSAIVKKVSDHDVEDDVIWVDERPLASLPEEKSYLDPSNKGKDKPEDAIRTKDNCTEIPAESSTTQNSEANHSQTPVPAPKKRGRKPKKTPDGNIAIEVPNLKTCSREEANQDEVCIDSLVPEQPALHDTDPPKMQPQLSPPPMLDKPIDGEDINIASKEPDPHPDPPAFRENPNVDNKPEQQPSATPKKPVERGPDKHSPIAVNKKVPYRVGLSRKARIAPLLKVIHK